MAISLRCVKCKRMHSIKTRILKCLGCGTSMKASTTKVYMVRCKLPNGSWKSKQVQTLDLAVKVEAKFKTQALEDVVFNIKTAPLINQIWEKYLSWAMLNKRSWKDDKARWEMHIIPHIKGLKTDRVTADHIQGILNEISSSKTRLGTPYKPATIKQVLLLIKRVYNWSIERKYYYGTNPCTGVDSPKFDNRVTNPLDKQSLNSLLKVTDSWENERASLVVKFGLYSGKRKGEILSLAWDNVDLENGYITLLGTNTKSKEVQVLPLNNTCASILERANEIRISDFVFPSNTGGFYHSFDTTWQLIKKKAGVKIRFHDLRHTFASYLASSGKVDIYTLKTLLGHKTISMTQRYAHLIDGTLRKATGVADTVFTDC